MIIGVARLSERQIWFDARVWGFALIDPARAVLPCAEGQYASMGSSVKRTSEEVARIATDSFRQGWSVFAAPARQCPQCDCVPTSAVTIACELWTPPKKSVDHFYFARAFIKLLPSFGKAPAV